MRLLVTGGTGKLGAAVVTRASAAGHDVVATTRRSSSDRGTRARTRRSSSDRGTRARIEIPRRRFLDITDAEACHTIVRDVAPDVVIHTAYDAGDWRVTADGAVNVARATAGAGAHLVFVSSDAIFSGADSPYDEQARPDPVTRYGAAKAAAETAIRAVLPTATIARSSLILGPDSSMERLVHALAGGGDGILFTDQIRCPVHRDDLATALLELAGSGERASSTAAAPTPSVASTWAG